jgi:hypothetical protein
MARDLARAALLLFVIVSSPAEAKRRNRAQNQVNNRKRECETVECVHMDEDGQSNCVLRCQSEGCYSQVYLPEELEPGEIDLRRQRQFQNCLNKENRQQLADRHKRQREGRGEEQEEEEEVEAEVEDAQEQPSVLDSAAQQEPVDEL